MPGSPPPTSWLDPRIEVRDGGIEGRGLFARSTIAAGDIVVRLGGRLIDGASMRALALDAARRGERYSALQVDEDAHLLMAWDDPASRGNHSCDPDLWLVGATTLVVRRHIEAGQELTTDYATMTADEAWSMPCVCDEPACRRTVRGDDWRLPELQARYRGHFSPFLERRIEALRKPDAS